MQQRGIKYQCKMVKTHSVFHCMNKNKLHERKELIQRKAALEKVKFVSECTMHLNNEH